MIRRMIGVGVAMGLAGCLMATIQAGGAQAMAFIKSHPDQSLEVMKPAFKEMDPKLLQAGFKLISNIIQDNARFSHAAWKVTRDFSVETGLIKPAQELSKFEGVAYTNEYVK